MKEMIETILHYDFMKNALFAAILVGLIVGIVGVLMILRGLSLMGDPIGHSVLPGIALSYVFSVPYIVGATVFGLIASLLIGFLSDKTKLKRDTVLGLTFSSFFAIGAVIISQIRTMNDLQHILFGNILVVSSTDLRNLSLLALVVISLVVLFYKELLLTSFDPTSAALFGMKTKLIHYSFLFILTLVIVLSIKIVGVILIVALMITPAATSYLVTNRMHQMIFLATGLSVFSSILGILISLHYNTPAGATIVCTIFIIFLSVLLFAPQKGLLAQSRTKKI